jgi:NAD(P)-dependent dehydrogenase (short-subunit alcohol dehydrogenase family)
VREVTSAIVAGLVTEGYRVRQVTPGPAARQLNADRFEADFASPDQLKALHSLLTGPDGAPVGGVISFLALSSACFAAPDLDLDDPGKIALWTFNVIKEFETDLRTSADAGGGRFINLTALGGKFGLGDGTRKGALQGVAAAGTLGITKTLARECPSLAVKNVDVDMDIEPHLLSSLVMRELAAEDSLLEVGLSKYGRWRLELTESPVPATLPPVPLEEDAVVLVTGGAYGVTADVARALASRTKARLIIAGRSPIPASEDSQTIDLDPPELRKKLIEAARASGGRIAPAEIERALHRILKDRMIRANLDTCRAAGSAVEYHAVDVRDSKQFSALIDAIYARHGRLDGVIHGAGIIEDKRIRDKTAESFTNVFQTKAASALTLARKLRPEGLKFLVFFSSVSGRFGNVGQADYSAANEYLNKLAGHLQRQWPARVVAINWGPWDGGMVSDDLRKMYATVGFQLIPVEDGVEAFCSEIRLSESRVAEVIISCNVDMMTSASQKEILEHVQR